MTDIAITPLDLRRPIAHALVRGERVDIFPNQEFVRAFNALLQRTGGSATDLIAATARVAVQAQSTASSAAVAAVEAKAAGAPSGFTLNPSNPIGVANTSSTQAIVSITAHTRTPTGMGSINLNSGSVTITRGVSYTIYYIDPTDAGGAVTYLATDDPNVAGDYAAGARIVGAAFSATGGNVYSGGRLPGDTQQV